MTHLKIIIGISWLQVGGAFSFLQHLKQIYNNIYLNTEFQPHIFHHKQQSAYNVRYGNHTKRVRGYNAGSSNVRPRGSCVRREQCPLRS